jgi:hypothetical protein
VGNRKERRFDEKLKRKVSGESPLMEFQLEPSNLQVFGPIIQTDIGITAAHVQALQQNKMPIPERVRARLLIDTGASRTLVKHDLADRAGLKLVNAKAPIQGIGVDTTGRIYIGSIWFICRSKVDDRVTHNIFVDTQIASGTLQDSTLIDGLIGRDVLRHFDFRYDGKSGLFTLRYLR